MIVDVFVLVWPEISIHVAAGGRVLLFISGAALHRATDVSVTEVASA